MSVVRNFIFLSLFPAMLSAGEPVEVLLSSDSTIYEEALAGLQSAYAKPVRIQYLDVITAEEPDLEQYFRQVEQRKPQAYVTFGIPATKAAVQYMDSVPVIFSMVNSPRMLGLERKNLCGVSMDVSAEYFFQTLKTIKPDASRVHAFYSSDQGRFIAEEGKYLDFKHDLYYTTSPVRSSELSSALEEIRGKADAIYMVPDPVYDRQAFMEVSRFAKRNGIILMSPFPALVRLGTTFGYSPDYTNIGMKTGAMLERISAGSDCTKELVKPSGQPVFTLNQDYAATQKIPIPESVRERARLSGLLNVGVDLFRENKLRSAKAVFESILNKDPGNPTVKHYRSLVIRRLTSDKTSVFFDRAERYEARRNYPAARAQYSAVLQLNPDDPAAKTGFARTSRLYSEQETRRGQVLSAGNDPFAAMRAYQTAISVWPDNRTAAAALAALRNEHSSNIPRYMSQAQGMYQARNYDRAIALFNNVLLIHPGHTEAGQYVRLSREKKAAIERLLENQ